MEKIQMTTPIVEMDGDEMAGILWKEVKRQLVEPFVDLKEEYYDLNIRTRDETDDQVTMDSALAAKKYCVAVKCATITANAERMEEFKLKKLYKSPNATIRSVLDGTVFRAPILINGIEPLVKTWKKLRLTSIESVMPSSHSSSVVPFSSYPQSLPASESFPMSQLFA